jgi:hypothetical protein
MEHGGINVGRREGLMRTLDSLSQFKGKKQLFGPDFFKT